LTNRLKPPGSATSTTTTGPNERQRTQKAATHTLPVGAPGTIAGMKRRQWRRPRYATIIET
jgi:hypothetical protein